MTRSDTPIFLIGPMGSGKTVIGRRLAELLRLDYFDTDMEIQQATGVDISFIFDKEGEQGFRDRETKILHELAGRNRSVIATGGGIVVREENRNLLAENERVIFLSARPEVQFERTKRGKHRPLLERDDPLQILKTLYAERLPLYRAVMTIEFATDDQQPLAVAEAITKYLGA